MEPIRGWSPGGSAAWLRGLHASIQQYPFEQWKLTGEDLLRLSSQDLESFGVKSIGHQELILEAVEQLCALNYELKTDSLRSLTEKLKSVCMTLWTFILSRRKVSAYDGTAIQRPPADLLTCVIQLVSAARSLFSWLNRYLFTRLNDYSSSREVISLCGELAEIIHKDNLTVSDKEDRILSVCQNISGVCDNILSHSPESLLSQRASLETVQLVPVPPEDSLGIEITSTSFGLHFVSGTLAESPAGHSAKVLPGDEIIQVNGQVVVGWSRMNLVKKLLEKSSGVSLVLKKVTLSSPDQPSSPASPRKQVFRGGSDSPGASRFRYDDSPRGSIIAPPSLIVAEILEKADSDVTTPLDDSWQTSHERNGAPQQHTGSQTGGSVSSSLEGGDVLTGVHTQGPSTPASPAHETPKLRKESQAAVIKTTSQPGSEAAERKKEDNVVNKRKQKGVATRLSRRRVSCRDLGQADCDGWLWKKKENPGFMSQRWKRCWCHLTGNSFYWYNHPNDEKAIGLINVSTYYLESPRETKKKYEFQLSHEKYKPFVFAADSLSDMSMWVTRLITSVTKYTTQAKSHQHKEEDCYSESEVDDPEEEIPRRALEPKEIQVPTQGDRTLQGVAATGSTESSPQRSPLTAKRPESGTSTIADPPAEDIETLFKCLTQGGVSLIGKERLLTREQFRKSFAKRNKNPVINERVHEVRTLQSTLKAKMAELQVLDQVLNNTELTSEKFKTWKKDHEELYKELQSLWVTKPCGEKLSIEEESPTEALEMEKHQNVERLQETRGPLETGVMVWSAQEIRSLPVIGSPQETRSLEIKHAQEMSPQEMWSSLDMGSPLEMGKLMESLEEIGSLHEKGSSYETWKPPERDSPKETRSPQQRESTQEQGSSRQRSFNETGSTREKESPSEKGSMQEEGSMRERSFNETGSTRKKGSTQERSINETGSTQERSFNETGSTRKKGSTRERSFNETGSTRERRRPRIRESHRKRGNPMDSGSIREPGTPQERGSAYETLSGPEMGQRESGNRRESRSSQGKERLWKMGNPQEEECVQEKGSPRERRSSEGRERAQQMGSHREEGRVQEQGTPRERRSSEGRSHPPETPSIQQERKKSPDTGQDEERKDESNRERRLYLCI